LPGLRYGGYVLVNLRKIRLLGKKSMVTSTGSSSIFMV
jgi:hypothetical protein